MCSGECFLETPFPIRANVAAARLIAGSVFLSFMLVLVVMHTPNLSQERSNVKGRLSAHFGKLLADLLPRGQVVPTSTLFPSPVPAAEFRPKAKALAAYRKD